MKPILKLYYRWMAGAVALVTLCPGLVEAEPAATNSLPKFDEIYQLLRANLAASNDEIDRAAVKGLIDQFPSRVRLVKDSETVLPSSGLARRTVFEGAFAYLRIAYLRAGTAELVAEALKELGATNQLKGLVLDLRFAGGTDFDAAARVADLFVGAEKPLLSWADHDIRSTGRADFIKLPLAVLANKDTTGAAEALAAVLREIQAGLIVGASTAGQASLYKEFTLEGGQRLLVATAPVKIGAETTVPADGLKPDIEVKVESALERAWQDDPYKPAAGSRPPGTGTAALSETNRPRLNEAELMRRRREGLNPEDDFGPPLPVTKTASIKASIKDPALARALELLKAIAVVQRAR